jgi:hypothetical protein
MLVLPFTQHSFPLVCSCVKGVGQNDVFTKAFVPAQHRIKCVHVTCGITYDFIQGVI